MGDLSNDATAIRAAVDLFYERMLAEPTIAPAFAGIDLHVLKRHQRAFVYHALGGASVYSGRDMRTAHAGLGIDDAQFTMACRLLTQSLRDSGVAADVIDRAIVDIEKLRPVIVEAKG
jgi:hemoglobin